MAGRGSAAEALPCAVSPFLVGDCIRFSREVVAEDEFADSGAFGDATDLGDIGVQRGHPGQFGIVHAVAPQVTQVGHLVDQDVGALGQGWQ